MLTTPGAGNRPSKNPRPQNSSRSHNLGRRPKTTCQHTLCAGQGTGLPHTEESAAYPTPKAAEASPSPLPKGRGLWGEGLLGVVYPEVLAVSQRRKHRSLPSAFVSFCSVSTFPHYRQDVSPACGPGGLHLLDGAGGGLSSPRMYWPTLRRVCTSISRSFPA